MNRRDFSTLGMSAAAIPLVRSTSGQTTQAPSLDHLAKALPSAILGPSRRSELPGSPSDRRMLQLSCCFQVASHSS